MALRLLQLTGPQGAHYVNPEAIADVGPEWRRDNGDRHRQVYLLGGHKITIDDSPDNMKKLLDPPTRFEG